MTPGEQDAYRAAVEPWAKKAERERKVITHVRYRDGHADVALEARKRAEPVPAEPTSGRSLLL